MIPDQEEISVPPIIHPILLLGVTVIVIFTLSCGAGPYYTEPKTIVDMHCHVGGIGVGSGCFVSKEIKSHFFTYHWRLFSFGVTEQDLKEKGDDLIVDRLSESLAQSEYVDKAVLLAMDGVVGDDGRLDEGQTQMYIPNEFVLKAVASHPNLLFGASVNPYREDALERLEWAEHQGAVLVKWLPSVMLIDPDDRSNKRRERLIRFYEKLVALDLPLLTHTGDEQSFYHPKNELADPGKLELPLSYGVKVIAAHSASLGEYKDDDGKDKPGIVILAKLMKKYPNLYADISALTQLNRRGAMKGALTQLNKDRLLYGSDYPLINTFLVSPWYYSDRLTLGQIVSIWFTENPWDRDVRIKQALGTPTAVFDRSREFFKNEKRVKAADSYSSTVSTAY